MSAETAANPGVATLTTTDGFKVTTNASSEASMRENFAEKAKPAPEAKPEHEDVEKLGADGRTRDGAGKFTGKVAPIKDKEPKKVEAKPEEKKADEKIPEKPAEAKADEGKTPEQPKKRAKERIHELIEQRRETERLLAEERRRTEALLRERTPEKAAERKEQRADADDDPRPDPRNYEGREAEYAQDEIDWRARKQAAAIVEKELKRREAEGQKVAYQKALTEQLDKFDATIAKAGGAEYWKTLPPELRDLRPSWGLPEGEKAGPLNALADHIIGAGEDSPKWLNYLKEHQDVFRRFSSPSLSSHDFMRLIGRIEASLESATADTSDSEEPPAKAPAWEPTGKPPVRSVAGGAATVEEASFRPGMSLDEYAPIWKKQVKQR